MLFSSFLLPQESSPRLPDPGSKPDPGHDPGSGKTRVVILRRLFISLLTLVGVALSGAVVGPGTAHAQGSDIDLAVSIVLQDNVQNPTITVANYGSDNAYHVRVVMKVDGITLGTTLGRPSPGTVALHPTDSTTTLIWSIPRMPGNRTSYKYLLRTTASTSITVVQYTATVHSGVFLEPEALRHNNHAEVWQLRISGTRTETPDPTYAIEATVDNRFPQAQGSVTFTLVARNLATGGTVGHLSDARVDVLLPAGGLTYTSHTAPTGTSYDSNTGIWTIGDWRQTTATHSLTLTATLAADAVLNEQCVTAEISAKPPEPIDETVNNRSTVCLGVLNEPVLFQSEQVNLFTPYPCVGNTTSPCNSQDTVEMLALKAEGEQYILPQATTVQVLDPEGRIVDGANIAWRIPSSDTLTLKPSIDNSLLSSSDWTKWLWKIAAVQLPTGGHLSIGPATSTAFAYVHTGTKAQHPPGGLTALPAALKTAVPVWIKFEALGTYIVNFTQATAHATASGDCDTDGDNTNDALCATEAYTFHVGPVAELAVRDDGPSPDATSSQRAFTIMALNTGPDSAPAAKVTVDLQGASVSPPIASQGTYRSGEWFLGELQTTDYYQTLGQTAGPTLTFITTDPVDAPITATITNTQDYQVCIDSSGNDLSHTTQATCEADTTNGGSWHTAKYYDYISTNNTATVTAQTGTAPPQADITVEWTAPADVTVSRYQVWRQGSPWKLIAEVPTGQTSYTDSTAEPGRAYLYMVRAMDAQGIPVSSETLVAAPPQTGGQGGQDGSGGSTRPPPTDHHGNSPATATPLAPTARVGGLLHYGDQDYFRLVLPHTGLLYVETTGWSNTVGTVWQGGVELGSAELGGRLYNFKLGVPVQPGPVVIRVTERSPTAFGTYRLYTRFIAGAVEQPRPITVQNGLGMVAGWLCSEDPVVLEIDGLPYHPAPQPAPVPPPLPHVVGTGGSGLPPRAVDPHELCDDTATGFGLPVNWNLLGDGQHTLIAYLDGIEFARTLVDVTTLGEEFVHDAHGTCSVADFPLPDHSVSLVWQEAGQHFALSDGQPPPSVGATSASDVLGRLETPAPSSFQSGRGSISGWVCDAEAVSVEINGTPYPVAYGTARLDVAAVCETPAPGFGLSLDWNRLGPGDHEVVALADGAEFGRATVRVTTLGAAFARDAESAFIRGLAGECVVEDFPAPGEAVHLEWQETTQNFVITGVE